MSDKTLGAYKRTTPDPDETTGEVLARLQAELRRLLDEADAELRDEADGGVAAALIEQEAEKRDPSVDYHAMWWKAEREREKAERERDEALAGVRVLARENIECHERFRAAEPRPLTPDAMTAREHLEAAMKGGLTREDIPNDMCDRLVASRADTVRQPTAPGDEYPRRGVRDDLLAALTEPPARPEGAEDIDEHLRQANAAALGGALTPEQRRALADHLAGFGYRTPIGLAEDGAA